MTFNDETELFSFIKDNESTKKYIETARRNTKELKALVTGKGFLDELIHKIEKIESEDKKVARKKYSRSIKDFYTRLLRPLDNVYHSTGGTKRYNIDSEKDTALLMKHISKVRGGKSLERWLETFWMPQYHSDPSGVIFLEYTSDETGIVELYPTYKSIGSIRAYIPNGQKLEVIMFEPFDFKLNGQSVQVIRVVDDKTDYTVIKHADTLQVVRKEDNIDGLVATFDHPFGEVPALINSDLIDIDVTPHQRESPIQPIDELTKEIARDQSVKTLYKLYSGFPVPWRYVQTCNTCNGTKRDGTKKCPDCDGKGHYMGKDVTDMVTLPIPTADEVKLAPDIAGHITLDLGYLEYAKDEGISLENIAKLTHWGAVIQTEKVATATEIIVDLQPMKNRLNTYSDVAEMMEEQLTEWFANAVMPSKTKDERISQINYGKNFIIEPVDALLERYNTARKEGDNNTILDRLFSEYVTAKYKNDPVSMRTVLIKSKVEPYLHSSPDQVNDIFGKVEAQKKVLFQEWWETLSKKDVIDSDVNKLTESFNAWLLENQSIEESNKGAQTELRGSVGGIEGIIKILTGISEGTISKESGKLLLVGLYGMDEDKANTAVDSQKVVEPKEQLNND